VSDGGVHSETQNSWAGAACINMVPDPRLLPRQNEPGPPDRPSLHSGNRFSCSSGYNMQQCSAQA